MASPPGSGGHLAPSASVGDAHVRKSGYLRKQKHGHKRFFVLRAPSDGCGARLEYYESEKKWRNRAAAKRVISLDSCLNINKRADAKHRHLIALYTKDEYFAVAAENEQEQEDWYGLLSELMLRGRVSDGAATHSASSLLGFDEGNYGMIAPASAAYKEVWQVTLKSRGLGHSRNLTGVYRLCLSSRTVSFVKLNSEAAAVVLQLMNIRRCGHSDSFFFVEVGRSAVTGPGELWMQADDAVVAQNIHETILEAMKAMKELSEFRPRSKSQSSGTNPISVPSRRHLNNLPPSQTGLLRRSRTDGAAATSPVGKLAPCRIRTASEGDGTVSRPLSVSGSPIGPGNGRAPLNRSNTLASRPCRPFEPAVLQHSKSMSMPVSRSPPSAPSSLSLSSSSGNGSASDALQRPASDCASVSGSPSDAGFISCDEYGSSPGDPRQLTAHRSDTPDFVADTPSSRGSGDLNGYVPMERPCGDPYHHGWLRCRDDVRDLEKAYRKRTYSLTTPPQQRAPSQASSASLDEYTLMRATCADGHSGRNSHAASPKVAYPEDYGDVEIGSLRSSGNNLGDDGYMAMSPGVAPPLGGRNENYMPMSPMTVSAPKQIINPRAHGQTAPSSYRVTSPGSCSLEDSGYMRMLCGPRLSADSSDGKLPSGEYINMSPVEPCVSLTPPDGFLGSPAGESLRSSSSSPFSSLPRSYKAQMALRGAEGDQYVMMMSLQGHRIPEELSSGAAAGAPAVPHSGHGRGGGRVNRPTRLSLDTVRTLPCMTEHPQPTEPRSPGEYINLDFGDGGRCSPSPLSTGTPVSGARHHSPLSDYMNVDVDSQLPRSRVTPASRLDSVSESVPRPHQPDEGGCPAVQGSAAKEDYTEMSFGSPNSGVQRLTLGEQSGPGVEAFLVPAPPPDPDRGAKVIRANPQGRRRHSSETFSSTTTVMPVFPSFAHDVTRQSSASVENVWARGGGGGEGSDEDGGSSMRRETSAGFQNGLNYIALNLMDEKLGSCKNLVKLRAAGASCCKAGVGGLHGVPYASFAFKETAATVKD
ncbi:insulin receptor substrate 2-like [Scleropages formosus]|uniref:Insulin receptor substrate 2 n=1 Tax=Scleropages formosus TaxID=113540 RepID=A0A8C9SPL2_SCLFO|nr:insulin receptor substrate 2 [Scleropages formosus]